MEQMGTSDFFHTKVYNAVDTISYGLQPSLSLASGGGSLTSWFKVWDGQSLQLLEKFQTFSLLAHNSLVVADFAVHLCG